MRKKAENANEDESRAKQINSLPVKEPPEGLSPLVDKANQEERDGAGHALRNGVQEVPVPRRDSPFAALIFNSIEVKAVKLRPHQEQLVRVGPVPDIILQSPEEGVNRYRDEERKKGGKDSSLDYLEHRILVNLPSYQVIEDYL